MIPITVLIKNNLKYLFGFAFGRNLIKNNVDNTAVYGRFESFTKISKKPICPAINVFKTSVFDIYKYIPKVTRKIVIGSAIKSWGIE